MKPFVHYRYNIRMADLVTESFKCALQDYFFLLNKGYPETPTLKLVGDRYRLTGLQRNVLYRGITSKEKSLSRKSKLTGDLKGKQLYVDGYNVLFSIMNYLLGKTVFIGNDGILRDAGGAYGKIENETFFYKAIDIVFNFIKESGIQSLIIYLDSPVTNSGVHKKDLENKMSAAGIEGKVFPVKLADSELKERRDGMIATSDSGIIDVTDCKVFDLARQCLEKSYKIKVLDLG